MEKILITGTGRCGTTFLIKLFSFLDFDTGFNRSNYKNYIAAKCNAGMEKKYYEPFYILKNPLFIYNINTIIRDKNIKIKKVIIPIRDYKYAALSRVKNHDYKDGGLWNAKDENSQISFYMSIISNYLLCMTKHEIDTIFIDFDKMIKDKRYLFDKLKSILDEKNIDFDLFSSVYDEVTATSKPKK